MPIIPLPTKEQCSIHGEPDATKNPKGMGFYFYSVAIT